MPPKPRAPNVLVYVLKYAYTYIRCVPRTYLLYILCVYIYIYVYMYIYIYTHRLAPAVDLTAGLVNKSEQHEMPTEKLLDRLSLAVFWSWECGSRTPVDFQVRFLHAGHGCSLKPFEPMRLLVSMNTLRVANSPSCWTLDTRSCDWYQSVHLRTTPTEVCEHLKVARGVIQHGVVLIVPSSL